jgi:hypothetical protein
MALAGEGDLHVPEPASSGSALHLPSTAPQNPNFFTLHEAKSYAVLVRQDYADRLNAPTPHTKQRPRAPQERTLAASLQHGGRIKALLPCRAYQTGEH